MRMRTYRKPIVPVAVVYPSVFPTQAGNINKQMADMKT